MQYQDSKHLQKVFGVRLCLSVPVSLWSGTRVWGKHNPPDHRSIVDDQSKPCPYHPRSAAKVLPCLSCYYRQCRCVAVVCLFFSTGSFLFPSRSTLQYSTMPPVAWNNNRSPELIHYASGKLRRLPMLCHHPQFQVFPFHLSEVLLRPELPLARPGLPLVRP